MAHLKGVVRFKSGEGKEVINVEGVIYQEVERRAQEGDVILLGDICDPWFKNHNFYVVLDVDCDGDFIARDEDGDQAHIEWRDIERVYEKLQKVSEETSAQFKVGDRVILEKHSGCTNGFRIGEVYIISRLSDGDCKYEIKAGALLGYVNDEHISLCVSKFLPGDKVVIIADTHEHDPHKQPLGTVVTIKGIAVGRYKRYTVDCKKDTKFFTEEDLRPATESDLKWAGLGRRVGELKDGDVVRFLKNTGTHKYPNGSLAIIRNVHPNDNGFRFTFGQDVRYAGDSEWVELVSPAESVVNLKVTLE